MRKNKKRLLPVLLTMVMAITMYTAAPMSVYAGTIDDADYAIYLNNDGTLHQNNSGGADITTELAAAGAVVTGGPTGPWTLTLNNFNFTTSADLGIYVPGGTTIILKGKNSITSTCTAGTDYDYPDTYPVYPDLPLFFSDGLMANGALTISGPGSLAVTSGNSEGASYGIMAVGLTINGGATVAATSGTASFSMGIYDFSGFEVSDNSTVTAKSGTADFSAGIFAFDELSITGKSSVTATGGTSAVTPSVFTGSYGIYVFGIAPLLGFSGKVLQAAGENMAIAIYNSDLILGTFTVPEGYLYWVNTTMSRPVGSGTLSDGTFIIDSTYRFARIELYTPQAPAPNVPQTNDVNNTLGWAVVLALVFPGAFGLIAWRRRQRA